MKTNTKTVSALAGSLLLLMPVVSSADLIHYDVVYLAQFEGGNVFPGDLFRGSGEVVVDTEKSAFVNVFFNEAPVTIDWAGETPLVLNIDGGEGFAPGTVRGFFDAEFPNFSFWFDLSYPPETDPLAFLDGPGESYVYYQFSNDQGSANYKLHASFTDKTYLVPEPATLSLLALGLAAIGIRRRYS